MALSIETVVEEALNLPTNGRALLVERLLDSLSGEISPAVERAHLDDVRKRRAAARSGKGSLIDGKEALKMARSGVRK